ncbi:urea carboxylase [Aquirhabdus sp.]|uniref:urea carboxylase n=1 Tax=Aquirhabdus sp. TaxID=2824160 RepID=UPI00396CBF68
MPNSPKSKFTKVLIANRGAIACRIIRTLKLLGIQSVAVYSEADHDALHVSLADEAVCIGPAPASESYLQAGKILAVAKQTGAQAIHPGYGFLSENAAFADECEANGIAFIGPTGDQMRAFGLKHTARELALQSNVPLLPGSQLLADLDEARTEATRIGYPVMLKSTAGGGGIGMRLIWADSELDEAYASVSRLAKANFKDAGLYLEKYVQAARHIEVQIFGDGQGKVLALGERDCSVQRRNQKVIEETPAPHLSDAQRKSLQATAVRLMESIGYRSAGTVEFVMDALSQEFYFLEVNTRLQVEHGVTEEVTGVDLVAWMVLLASGDLQLPAIAPQPKGASIQVRVYAEDPARNFQPSSGVLTEVIFPHPSAARVEAAVMRGSNVPPFYDPMVAKIIVYAKDREAAIAKLQHALTETHLSGIETNLDYVSEIIAGDVFQKGLQTTRYLNDFSYQAKRIEVLEAGVQTSVQDYPARLGYWDVGVPPSGPMDSLALRAANLLLGNTEGTAGLECTMSGPTLKFYTDSSVCITGAPLPVFLDDVAIPMWTAITIKAGSVLKLGRMITGCRSYIAVQGGIDVPDYLGSKSTFTLGQFGGHAGRNLRLGDMLPIKTLPIAQTTKSTALPLSLQPTYNHHWEIGVLYGPHGAPDFFTPADIEMFFSTDWEIHYNSSRTGVRLNGPKPQWARRDGGEAGLHPSNIHDNAYAIGAIDFTGDMPVILGPDGPSLGGFVCPAVVVKAELWKLGQLRPGDTVRFIPISQAQTDALESQQLQALSSLQEPLHATLTAELETLQSAILSTYGGRDGAPDVVYRPAGDNYLLVEYGALVLDLNLRFRVHALMQWLYQQKDADLIHGIIDLTPGIRSLQIHYDAVLLPQSELLTRLKHAEHELPAIDEMVVPSRTVWLPLAWDDSQTRLAIEKYMQSVRPDAPWCPSNIEFIRRINGLDSIDDVKKIVFDASYLVMGLGDVYLGAPVATPLDPRHRLVTTKYNPARTWTPENAVGIGGAYMCVYGMEGPGGYQFVGRTIQMWNRYRETPEFEAGKPWLLRFFDQIRFYEVSEEELLDMRREFAAGRMRVKIEEGELSLRQYNEFLTQNADSITAFKTVQQDSFDAERERWRESGQAEYISEADAPTPDSDALKIPDGADAIAAHVPGNIWQVQVKSGDAVRAGDTLLIIESMKMEFPIVAARDGIIGQVLAQPGVQVGGGQNLLVLLEAV